MTHKYLFLTRLFLLLTLSFISQTVGFYSIPLTGSISIDTTQTSQAPTFPTLSEFRTVVTANPGGFLSGIYVENLMANPIVQQPSNNPGYVSQDETAVTQFGMASQFNTIGILAHNNKAGAAFSKLGIGEVIYLVQSTGTLKAFRITKIQQYQALSPNSPYSNFINMQNSNTITAQTLFTSIYGQGGGVLILQTCIEKDGNPSWGRLFVMATPLVDIPLPHHTSKVFSAIQNRAFNFAQME
jgi:hypothetical protein